MLKNDSDPVPYLNRYRNAGHFDDNLVKQVLNNLATQGLLKNTIVIITADHGEEFNESHQDFWGHASDYTRGKFIHACHLLAWPSAQKLFLFNESLRCGADFDDPSVWVS